MPSLPDEFRFNVLRVWLLCQECARGIYGAKAPTAAYAANVARFLVEICAQEGSMRWERQRSPRFEGDVGGFSKWQMEPAWIKRALNAIRTRPEIGLRATDFIFADPNCPLGWVDRMPLDAVLWALRMNDNDRFALALCRIGIFEWPEPIPATVDARADLWKRKYNTAAGAGTVAQYLKSAATLVDPYLIGLD